MPWGRMHEGLLRDDFTKAELEHLQECEACQATRRRFEAVISHPTEDQLKAYHEGRLEGEELAEVRHHLEKDRCKKCLETITAEVSERDLLEQGEEERTELDRLPSYSKLTAALDELMDSISDGAPTSDRMETREDAWQAALHVLRSYEIIKWYSSMDVVAGAMVLKELRCANRRTPGTWVRSLAKEHDIVVEATQNTEQPNRLDLVAKSDREDHEGTRILVKLERFLTDRRMEDFSSTWENLHRTKTVTWIVMHRDKRGCTGAAALERPRWDFQLRFAVDPVEPVLKVEPLLKLLSEVPDGAERQADSQWLGSMSPSTFVRSVLDACRKLLKAVKEDGSEMWQAAGEALAKLGR